ncbi:MAG: ornithine aminomutase subunit alpha [Anaerolineaceae bacterium]|nr:ornithine aminomutase subunit alpha [Anaerolineaceae bacterium]
MGQKSGSPIVEIIQNYQGFFYGGKMTEDRIARFEKRQAELKQMSDAELKERFWLLCDQLVEPIVEMSKTHTSPSIERSVLLRMGIDSISAHGVVDRIYEAGLLGKGAGHVVLKLSQKSGKSVREAAAAILENKEVLQGVFDQRKGDK